MFTITQNAFKRILHIKNFEDKPNLALKVIVEGGGCSGFKYDLDFLDDYNILVDDDYTKFESDNKKNIRGAIVMVDNDSLKFLENSTLDFVETLSSKSFIIQNPDATARCGCGISFAI